MHRFTWCVKAAHHGRPGGRNRRARGSSLRGAGRLATRPKRCNPTWPGGNAGRPFATPAGPDRPRRRSGLRQGTSAGPLEDHVQDGHQHVHVVLGASRSCRSHRGSRRSVTSGTPRTSRASAARWAEEAIRTTEGLRRRPGAGRRCSSWRKTCREAPFARSPAMDPDAIGAAARHAPGESEDPQGIRGSSTTTRAAVGPAPEGGGTEFRLEAGRRFRLKKYSRRPWSGVEECHRRHVARFRSAPKRTRTRAGRSHHEPHRRQEQHRRRWRRPGALPAELKDIRSQPNKGVRRVGRKGRGSDSRCSPTATGSAQQDQAGGLGPLRRHHRVPGPPIRSEIKMARRARSRRRGQLPGHKVTDYIGFRHWCRASA